MRTKSFTFLADSFIKQKYSLALSRKINMKTTARPYKKQTYNKDRYERQKLNPEFKKIQAERRKKYYERNKLNPEWVAKQTEKRRKKQQTPEWAAHRKEVKRKYDESVQQDPAKRKRRNAFIYKWRETNKELYKQLYKNKLENRKRNNPQRLF